MNRTRKALTVSVFSLLTLGQAAHGSTEDASKTVAALDEAYQAAVKRNDAAAMDTIVHDDFTLVNGRGIVTRKAALIESARSEAVRYERQDVIDNSRTVRVIGDTAVITAKLWIKGDFKAGGSIDKVLWFSDTYVKTPQGWKYFFGQASLALP
ncbi:MAG: nuclear transport factor 2 family protein [Pseudomonadota bacterium]